MDGCGAPRPVRVGKGCRNASIKRADRIIPSGGPAVRDGDRIAAWIPAATQRTCSASVCVQHERSLTSPNEFLMGARDDRERPVLLPGSIPTRVGSHALTQQVDPTEKVLRVGTAALRCASDFDVDGTRAGERIEI